MSTKLSWPSLFQTGDFTLRSGKKSSYKIECDALTYSDWEGIAAAIMEEKIITVPFGIVSGVPRGGIPLADALLKYATPGSNTVLICEDIVTTGGSMQRWVDSLRSDPNVPYLVEGQPVLGVCFIARGPCPSWVSPLLRGPGA